MWFWSVSWSTNCPVYFTFFLVTQRKNCPVSGNFWSVSDFFVQPFLKNGHPLIFLDIRGWPIFKKGWTKNSETDQKLPETGQFFLWPDNWSTKRLTKTTWTGLLLSWWITFIIFKIRIMWTAWFCHTRERQLIVKKKCESSDDTKRPQQFCPSFFLFFYIT